MIYLRPQKTYRAPAISDGRNENELFPPTDQSRYRVVAEALRGRVISNDNPQLCFTALFFDARDGSELTERLRENGFRPGWYLDGKAVDASLITDGGYTLTIGKEQLTNAFVRLTIRTRDTDILLALVHPDYRPIYERVIAQGAISSVVIEQSEDLVNQLILDELSKSALTEIKREFTLEINKKADKSELITPEQIKDLAHALDEERKVGGRNLILNSDRTIEIKVYDTQWDFLTYSPSINLNDLNGTPVTVSFWAKSSGGNQRLYISLARDNYSKIYLTKPKSVIIPKEWAYFSFSVAEKSEAELNRVIYATGYTGGATDGMVWLKNIKLERGNVATDWTPAPEDLLAELDKYTTLTQYNKNREEDSRKLEGKLDKPTSGKYILDTDIPKQFEELIKVGGRNLIVTKRWKAGYLYGDSTNGSPGEPEYKVIPNFYKYRYDPTYIPTEGNTTITYKLYDNGGDKNGVIQIHAYDKDKKFLWWDVDGWRGEIGRTRTYTLPTDTRYIRLGVTNKDVRAKVEFGNVATDWTPAPEDFQSDIKDLQQSTLTPIEKEWVGKMGSILFPNNDDNPQNKGGLNIDRSVFLRFSNGKPSALIGGQIGSDAVLMAGVQNYGTTNQTERTAIYQDGTAKFGDVNLNDKTITLMPKSGLPLRVTSEEGTFIENFLENSKVDKNIAYEHSFVLVGKGEARTYSFDVANNDTKLTITIPTLTSEVYQINQSVTLTLDGVTLGSWRGDTKLIREDTSGFEGGGVRFRKENTPLVVENLKFERYLNSGSHTLSVSVTSTDTKDKATISKLTAHLYYDASQAETNLTRYGFRAFGGQSRYFDIDWRWTYRYKGYMTTSNPYIARVKGGMRVDSLTLEQPLDAPGCVLAGGEVDSSGSVIKSFGKYKKKRGGDRPTTDFNYDTKLYTIYHSIGNTNYIPVVTSRSSAWADVPRVISTDSNSFTIKFINQENTSSNWRQMFIYTCYKAD